MPLRRIAAGITLVMMLAACSSAAPSGSTPPAVTPAPSASGTPVPDASATPPAATTPPATTPGTSQQPGPSFAGDPELAARFPTQVDGQPVTNVTIALFVDFLRAFNTPQAEIDSMRQTFATIGIDLDTVVMGSANATVDGSSVGILAIRVPGQDANKVIQNYALLNPENTEDTVSQETIGGKNVAVVRSAGGQASTWAYATGDIMWSVNTSDQKEAEAVFAALP
jgi:hypothetical protein